MARSLGAEVVVCAPLGGETGEVIGGLAEREGLRIRRTTTEGANGGYVHDRREGQRVDVATSPASPLGRHELDDLFDSALVEGRHSDLVVLTGSAPDDVVLPEVLGRLTADLRAAGRPVVADLSGAYARAFTEAGGTVLKISHEDVIAAGLAEDDETVSLVRGARTLLGGGASAVVVSRAERPALVVSRDGVLQATGPSLTIADHHGAGDSMTAGLAVGLARGQELREAIRLGVAAGALNVTRRGLGTGERDQVERLAADVVVETIDIG
jgi:1-phosphofructokinase